jgi:hypothetical protein
MIIEIDLELAYYFCSRYYVPESLHDFPVANNILCFCLLSYCLCSLPRFYTRPFSFPPLHHPLYISLFPLSSCRHPQVVVTPHRHGGVFIARGKEDALVTKNLVPGVSVYGEKRISVEV